MDQYEQLERLAKLKETGVITPEEFDAQKKKLLEASQQPPAPPVPANQAVPQSAQPPRKTGNYWLPIPSLVLGIFCGLCLLDDSEWDADTVSGFLMFAVIGLTLGIVGLTTQTTGKKMSIAGIILCSLSLLFGLGLLAE